MRCDVMSNQVVYLEVVLENLCREWHPDRNSVTSVEFFCYNFCYFVQFYFVRCIFIYVEDLKRNSLAHELENLWILQKFEVLSSQKNWEIDAYWSDYNITSTFQSLNLKYDCKGCEYSLCLTAIPYLFPTYCHKQWRIQDLTSEIVNEE